MLFVSDTATAEEIVNVIDTEGYSCIPVHSENTDNIIGVLYVRDYLLKRNNPNINIT